MVGGRTKHPRQRLFIVEGDRSKAIYGSDRRLVGGVRGRCKLCREAKILHLSHIAPRWAYRWMKMEGAVIGRYDSLGVRTRSQDGNKHYLLCSSCEQYLGEAESYLAALTRGTAEDLAMNGISMFPGPVLSNVRVHLVYRALAGLLFKTHYSDSPPYHRVGVRRRNLEALRQAVIQDGYAGFRLLATRWMCCLTPGINPRSMMFESISRPEGFAIFAATLGGTQWVLFFEQASLAAERFKPMLMGCNFLPVLLGDITQHRNLEEVRKSIGDLEDDAAPWRVSSLDEPCPCGLDAGRSFRDCCAGTWCHAADVSTDFGSLGILEG
jgi:hypothetical protein